MVCSYYKITKLHKNYFCYLFLIFTVCDLAIGTHERSRSCCHSQGPGNETSGTRIAKKTLWEGINQPFPV